MDTGSCRGRSCRLDPTVEVDWLWGGVVNLPSAWIMALLLAAPSGHAAQDNDRDIIYKRDKPSVSSLEES